MPVVDAARLVIGARLKTIEKLLPLADQQAHEDVEHIHRLRVATRRTDAALRIFAGCFKRKRAERVRRRLRRIRRAAGAAREYDVHGRALAHRHDTTDGLEAQVLSDLLVWIGELRGTAQQQVRDAANRYPASRLRESRHWLIQSLRPSTSDRGQATFHELALLVIPNLARGVDDAAKADLTMLDHLHKLRIVSKQLRYAMEIFRPCFGSGFKEAYALLKSLQDRLGVVNDDHELAALIDTFLSTHGKAHSDEWRSTASALAASFITRRDEDASTFLADWRETIGPAILRLDALVALGPG
jgi:CHAD domain-containing protein